MESILLPIISLRKVVEKNKLSLYSCIRKAGKEGTGTTLSVTKGRERITYQVESRTLFVDKEA